MIKIYGKNCIYEAIKAKAKLLNVFVLDKELTAKNNLVGMLEDNKIKYEVIDRKKMDSLFGNDHQGYGAYRKDYEYQDIDILKQDAKRVLILDGVTDPHNFGAILRSCDAFGIDGVIIAKNRSVAITQAVAKVSTGAIEYVNIIQVNNLTMALKELKEKGFWIVGTDASGNVEAKDIDKSLKLGIIIGSEGFGMARLVKEQCDYLLKIPMVGHVNSLNASVSAGIVLALLNQ